MAKILKPVLEPSLTIDYSQMVILDTLKMS